MGRLPVTITTEHRPDDGEPDLMGSFVRKHRLNGRAEHNVDSIDVVLAYWEGTHAESVRAALGHEVGHSTLLRTIEREQMAGLDRFRIEVDAWRRWAEHSSPHPLATGMLILDALNTYRRGYNTPEPLWQTARAMVEGWSVDPDALAEYEPLEPDPDEEPPTGCGGGDGEPGGLGEPMGDEPTDGGEDEGEPGEDGEPEDGDGDEDGGEPVDGEGGSDGDGEPTDGDVEDGTYGAGPDRPANRDERNRWLHQDEGIATAKQGQDALDKALAERGWDGDDLPPLTKAILSR